MATDVELVYQRTWARNNPEKRKQYRDRHRAKNEARVNEIKLALGCAHCGYAEHPAALEFHHRDPATKSASVGRLLMSSWQRIEDEIAKCDLLCSNCHSIEHYGKD